MSLSSDNRSSLEELKRRNLPSETQAGEPPTQTESPPAPETHPTGSEWDNLLAILSALYRLTAAEHDRTAEEITGPILYGMNEQLAVLTEEASAVRQLLEQERQRKKQAGKKRGRRFSIHFPRISLPRPSPGWLFLPLMLVALWALCYGWGVLWSALSPMFT